MRMRLLHVVSNLRVGGAQTQLRLLAQGLDARQFDVHVCALTSDHNLSVKIPLAEAGATIHELQTSGTIHVATWWRLVRLLRHLKPDVVHTWDSGTSIFARAAAWAAAVPCIIAAERDRLEDRRLRTVFEQQLLGRVTDAVVVNHPRIRDRVLSWGLPAHKVRFIPDGVRVPQAAHWSIPLASSTKLTDELNLPRRCKLAAIMGPLVREKRIKDAIWAVDLLSCVRDDVHLIVLGDGPQRSELENYARNVEVSDRVHFLGNRDDVPQLMKQCHVFWLTSEAESVSSGLLEAMALGVPTVVTRIPGTRGIVSDDETGLTISVGNRGELARATLRILDDSALAKRIVDAARARVLRQFSAEVTVQHYTALYHEFGTFPNGIGSPAKSNPSRRFSL